MLQQYVRNVSSITVFRCNQCFSCCKLQVFYLDVAYVFTHNMLQVYVTDVLSILDVCCIQVFHVACVLCYSKSQMPWWSDGGTTRTSGNGAWRAAGRQM
jgi:hypothetical protein